MDIIIELIKEYYKIADYQAGKVFKLTEKEFEFIFTNSKSKSILPLIYAIGDHKGILNFSHKNSWQQLSLSYLAQCKSLLKLVELLNKNNIYPILYKGILFNEIIYSGKFLRQVGDIDLIFKKEDAQKALNILTKNGYKIEERIIKENENIELIIPKILDNSWMNETTLSKNEGSSTTILDFHWALNYSFLPYKIPVSYFYNHKNNITIQGKTVLGTDTYGIIAMMAIHHAGRDCWTNFKHIIDLLAFMKKFELETNWQLCLMELESMKLKRPFLLGIALLERFFSFEISIFFKHELEKANFKSKVLTQVKLFWDNDWNVRKMKYRLKYEYILVNIQDSGFNTLDYYKTLLSSYGSLSPVESKRFLTFPEHYRKLNAVSKLITYIIKRGL